MHTLYLMKEGVDIQFGGGGGSRTLLLVLLLLSMDPTVLADVWLVGWGQRISRQLECALHPLQAPDSGLQYLATAATALM